MKVLIALLGLLALSKALHTHGDGEAAALPTCPRAQALGGIVKCWRDTSKGKWFTDEILQAGESFDAADWDEFVSTAFDEKNMTKAASDLFDPTGGFEASGLAFVLFLDDSVYSESADENRANMCQVIKDFLNCASVEGYPCFERLNARVAGLGRYLGVAGLELPKTANVESVLHLLAKFTCYICDNNSEGMRLLMETAIDDGKKTQLKDKLMDTNNRLAAYKNCQIEGQNEVAYTSADQFRDLLIQKPCDFLPYARCLADDAHNEVNPDSPNILKGMIDIFFNHVWECEAEIPLAAKNCDADRDVSGNLVTGAERYSSLQQNSATSQVAAPLSIIFVALSLILRN